MKKILSKKGFTLIEMLVVTAIIGVLAIVSATIFNSILSNQNKTSIINEVRQNGNIVIDKFERDIRGANNITLNSSTEIEVFTSGGSIIWQCVGNEIKRGSLVDILDLLNTNVRNGAQLLNDPPGTPVCNFIVSTSNPQIVDFGFTLEQRSTANKAEFESEVEFRTTVGTRAY